MPGASVPREETPEHVASRLAYFHQREKLAGKTGPPPTPSEHGALCDKLFGITDGASDAGIDPHDPHAFSTPERQAVLGNLRGIVEKATGIPQKWRVTELRIAPIVGAHGILTAEHQSADPTLPPTDVPGRITIDTAVHFGAQGALNDLARGESPLESAIANLHTYVHEICHTTSPMRLREGGYEGYGAVIEEVTTEVMARDVMVKILPDNIVSAHSQISQPRAGGSRGSYQSAIDWTVLAIRDGVGSATGHKGRKAVEAAALANPAGAERHAELRATRILKDATLSYRALTPAVPFTREKAAEHFAAAIGAAAVKHHPERELHAGEVSERVRIQLRQLDSGPDSDLLRRFDAAASVWTLPRNDVAAARAFVLARRPSPDEMSVLLMLQDNPSELLAELEKLQATDPKRFDGDWDEELHPRDEKGQFGAGGGGWISKEGDTSGGMGGGGAPKDAVTVGGRPFHPKVASAKDFKTAFAAAHAASDRQAYVTDYSEADLATMKACYVSPDGKAGVAVHDHGDGRIEGTALFNNGAEKGTGIALLKHAIIHAGVNYAECYGPHLNKMYEKLGFVEATRDPFNKEYAAPTWNYERDDHPDYVTMKRPPTPKT